jgi:hypothetical protein
LNSVVAVAAVVVTDTRRAAARATTRNMTTVFSTYRDARVARASHGDAREGSIRETVSRSVGRFRGPPADRGRRVRDARDDGAPASDHRGAGMGSSV